MPHSVEDFENYSKLNLRPEHLDCVDDTDIGVVEVKEPSECDGRQGPDEGDADVRDDGAAPKQLGSNVVHHNGLNACIFISV